MPAPKNSIRRSLLVTSAIVLSTALTAPAAFAAPSPSAGSSSKPSADSSATASADPSKSPSKIPSKKPKDSKNSKGSKDSKGSKGSKAAPPAKMSTVGGARLGRAGTQVNLASGVPVLPKGLSARSWIVADAESGEVLAAHNAHWELAPASTLKMLFADTLLPKWPSSTEHEVEPSDLAGIGSGSSMVGIKEDETYTVHDLWLGVFLRSGNDAVRVLAAMNGGVENTVAEMNEHAEELQALDTVVVSPDGYDAEGQVSSAYDLTLIARSGLQKKDFREYASTVRADFPGETRKNKKGKKVRESFEIQNTNRLLSGDYDIPVYQGIAGVKNGNTTEAGATFTGVAEQDGRVLLVTVMNPEKKEGNQVYKETAKLFDWGFEAAGKVDPVGELVPPRSAAQAGARPGGAGASPGEAGGTGEGALGAADGRPVASAAAGSGAGGVGTALAVTGGVLALLAGGAFLVNRRWPLPDLVRRRPRP
ncbi:D-alanyl-D-alanine carboxypeptidase family protein [Streptomyces sp. MAR25Y5]|uniref:D-alanyl-D-alanine carboxypeptidase family protein n=1 Tax=Streptomyces sp. MAR25Y5 TaxID=2962028 RepID=UPI0020B78DEB|nr:D-alanyl-D-alanine carboxypeptidase [Streptomyces sp. MAR25Y5]MCP3766601.1 D-alanyl-D-alanine carboxypeptidase [Streptomyces sp. MAR25Y5]